MTREPGLLVLRYKTRGDIEKRFDETQTQLQEKKSWATSFTAKEMQAHFVAFVHNLLLLVQDLHREQGVWPTPPKPNGNNSGWNHRKRFLGKPNRRCR